MGDGSFVIASRHDLRLAARSAGEPERSTEDLAEGSYGYVHSYEASSLFDGPGVRAVMFVTGCPLRCAYCHNPDTWHLKDGSRVPVEVVLDRLGGLAPALRAMDGGLTISGGEPLAQPAFTRCVLQGAKKLGLHTAIETSGFLGEHADQAYLDALDLVLLDIKSFDPDIYRHTTGREVAPTLRFAERLAEIGKPVWVRFTLVAGLTDDPANVDALARFVAPLKNVQRVEIQPFHQLGAFKWKSMGIDYSLVKTEPPTPELVQRVRDQFASAGCKVR
ncbi:MAG: pyruvate formate-lyase-activating protein [Rhodoblastus sp.]